MVLLAQYNVLFHYQCVTADSPFQSGETFQVNKYMYYMVLNKVELGALAIRPHHS